MSATRQDTAENDRRRAMRVIAHRGASGAAPENTLAALALGRKLGADGAEFDVHRTQDGEFVVIHDDDLWRTTNWREVFPDRPREESRVRDCTLAQLRELDAGAWKDAYYAGERIPTLREALATLRGGCVAIIEIKEEDIGEDVARIVEELAMTDEVIAIGFSPRAVADFHRVLPRAAIGLNREMREGDEKRAATDVCREHVAQAREIGANALIVDHRLVDRRYLEEAHGRGLSVWVYTVNDAERMHALLASGLDGLITNEPAVALAVRDGKEGPAR